MAFRDHVPASREAGCSPGGEIPQEEEIRLIRREQSTLPTALHLLHQECSGEGCSRSLGDEEMYFLGIVLRPVLLVHQGKRTCRSRGLHILRDKLKRCPKSPQFSQCFFSPQFSGYLIACVGATSKFDLFFTRFCLHLSSAGIGSFCGKLWTLLWRRRKRNSAGFERPR